MRTSISPIRATIIICTYDRPDELITVLFSIQRQTSGLSSVEVVVIDNSEDGSASTAVKQAQKNIPCLRYECETKVGLSNARNLGIKLARGEWIVYLDDDAIPDQNWLENLLCCIEHLQEPGVIGGAVLPKWSIPPPRWCTPELYSSLSLCNYEAHEKIRAMDFPREYPVGANIAYPRQLLEEFNGFNPEFGRQSNLLLSGEETELNIRIWSAGLPIWFCKGAIVRHHIPPDRLIKSFFRTRNYWGGRTWALLHQEIYTDRFYLQIVRHTTYMMTKGFARSLIISGLKKRNPFLFELYLHELAGYLVQAIMIVSQNECIRRQG